MTETFEQYAIVELFGRNIIAGLVSEQVIGGQGFVRVDVPAINEQKAFTKFYGPGSIYAITPCDELTMKAAVQGLRQKPVDIWQLNLPALDVPRRDPSDDDDLNGGCDGNDDVD
jgi:hypothetical protein